eukprot:Sspe_Gene.117541::Locus_109055_Transcript_1_3_Confidence_0.750_Length_402::g.117541::m.117541
MLQSAEQRSCSYSSWSSSPTHCYPLQARFPGNVMSLDTEGPMPWKKVPQGAVFVEEVPKHLKCPVCMEAMLEARELDCPCHTTLCKGCVAKCRKCPLCNKDYSAHRAVMLVQRTVKAL